MPRIALVFLGMLSLGAIACSRAGEPLTIVRAYNNAVIAAHRTGDTSKLADVAGEREARIVRVLVATKRGAGLVLEASLERIEVLKFQKTGDDFLLIEAAEQWRYYDRPLKPGAAAGHVIQAAMKVRYDCSLEGGRWKVMGVAVLENKFLNGKPAI